MVAQFEAVSVAMSDPGADLDALTNKMGRLQVCGFECGGGFGGPVGWTMRARKD
jgi:hypothetical protein